MLRLASGRYSDMMKIVAPEDELRKMTRNAWVFTAVYGVAGIVVALPGIPVKQIVSGVNRPPGGAVSG